MRSYFYAAATSVLLTVTVGTLSANAAEREKINPWLDCGLGAMIFPDENLEIGAGISNVTWDLGTTALTSASASPDTCEGTDNVKSALFIQQTYDELVADIARGRGEYVDALATLHNCDAKTSATFTAGLRAAFAEIVAAPEYDSLEPTEKAQQVYFATQDVLGSGVCSGNT